MSDVKLSDLTPQLSEEKTLFQFLWNWPATHVFLPRSMFMKTLSFYNPDTQMEEVTILRPGLEILQLKVVFVEGLTEIKVGVIG